MLDDLLPPARGATEHLVVHRAKLLLPDLPWLEVLVVLCLAERNHLHPALIAIRPAGEQPEKQCSTPKYDDSQHDGDENTPLRGGGAIPDLPLLLRTRHGLPLGLHTSRRVARRGLSKSLRRRLDSRGRRDGWPRNGLVAMRAGSCAVFWLAGARVCASHGRPGALEDSAAEIASLEPGRHHRVNDGFHRRIQSASVAAARLDPDLSLGLCHQQHDAVILRRIADAVAVEELSRESLEARVPRSEAR